jgi:hypothetical protein
MLTGSEKLSDGFYQPGVTAPKRGILPGCTVSEALEAVTSYRRGHKSALESWFIAVVILRPDGIRARYSARLEPGQTTVDWQASG